MSKKKVLIVTQEMDPYTALTDIASISRKLPQYIHEKGMEIRILMPRFGVINERRHRLHEVVRLSGMNIIVDDDDFPLIIKVASLPDARIQVYFLDNDDFFRRKSMFEDEEGKPFEDNTDRMVFFCKGVVETVKKFGWAPDIVHCIGWMTSLIPFYLKTTYQTEPLFQQSKVIYSVYHHDMAEFSSETFANKASINNLSPEDLDNYHVDGEINLNKGGIAYADAIILGSEETDESVLEAIVTQGKPYLDGSGGDCLPEYLEFYQSLLTEEEVQR